MTRRLTDYELIQWRPAKNLGGTDINPRELCRVCTGADSLGRSILAVTPVDSTWSRIYAVNGPTSLKAGRYGKVCLGPIVVVAYDSGSPAMGDGYGPKSGQGTASKNYPQALTAIRVVDSTSKYLLAFFQPIDHLIGKLDEALSQGSDADVSIWAGAGGSEADTGWNVNARDWLIKSGNDAIASGKKVVVDYINGIPYVTEAECP